MSMWEQALQCWSNWEWLNEYAGESCRKPIYGNLSRKFSIPVFLGALWTRMDTFTIFQVDTRHTPVFKPSTEHPVRVESSASSREEASSLWGGTAPALALRLRGKKSCPLSAEIQWAVATGCIKACARERFLCKIYQDKKLSLTLSRKWNETPEDSFFYSKFNQDKFTP